MRRLLAGVLLKDINTATASSLPSNLVALGSSVLFYADDGVNGKELWKLDSGAAARVTDFSSTTPTGPLVRMNGFVYFTVTNSSGTTIWRSDGTIANTGPITGNLSGTVSNLSPIGGKLFFTTSDTANGRRLWLTTGQAVGSEQVVKQFATGSLFLSSFTDLNGVLYFGAEDFTSSQLWKSDGTEAGTLKLGDFPPGRAAPNPPGQLTVMGGMLYFRGGSELWRSDGTPAGTSLVKQINPTGSSSIASMISTGTKLLFNAQAISGDTELWQSDGTEAGTTRVKDIRPGPAGSNPTFLTVLNGLIYFWANDGVNGTELWRSDGTDAGTMMVVNAAPGSASTTATVISAVGGALYYRSAAAAGTELWRSDGTAAGTGQVADIYGGLLSSNPAGFVEAGGTVYFAAADNLYGTELWKTQGSAATTQLAADINTVTNLSSFPGSLTTFNGLVFFAAKSAASGTELWKTDGTPQGTVMVKDIFPGPDSSSPDEFVIFNGQLYFSATNAAGRGLWKTDGTEAGTVFISDQDIPLGRMMSAIVGNTLYFVSSNLALGNEIWKTDGDTTTLVSDIIPGIGSGSPQKLIAYNGKVYFTYETSANGRELWVTDGTSQGTTILKDINPGSAFAFANSDVIQEPIIYHGLLYFGAQTNQYGPELWRTDGTLNGTVMVYDSNSLNTGYGLLPHDFHVLGDYLYFGGDDDVHGDELWRTDGTSMGTTMVADMRPGTSRPGPMEMADFNGNLYYTYSDGTHGYELFRSDGTQAGTWLLKDAFEGINSGSPDPVLVFGNLLWFVTNAVSGGTNETYARKLWASDGTPQGTLFVANLTGFTQELVPLQESLIFTNYDPATGTEIYKLPLPTAHAGGSYQVAAGESITLDGSQSSGSTSAPVFQFAWDLDGDGIFGETGSAARDGDEVGPAPTFYAYDIAPGSWTVRLRIIDSAGVPAMAAATVTVTMPTFMQLSPGAVVSFRGASGDRAIELVSGSLTLNADVSSIYPGISLIADGGTSVHLPAVQHLKSLTLLNSATADLTTSLFMNAAQPQQTLTIIRGLIQSGKLFSSAIQGDSHLAIGYALDTPSGLLKVTPTVLGDLNLDLNVSISDFIELASHFGQSDLFWQDGDLNGDRAVSIADFITLAANFGQSYAPTAPSPQPAAAIATSPTKARQRSARHHLHRDHGRSAMHWSSRMRRWTM